MRIHNLYEDANGESHFRDIEVDWVEQTSTGKLSKRLPANGIMFRETTTDYENSWHRAPRRQYVISLAGGISITASDGETRHIGGPHRLHAAAPFLHPTHACARWRDGQEPQQN
jgi:hypothetical protein